MHAKRGFLWSRLVLVALLLGGGSLAFGQTAQLGAPGTKPGEPAAKPGEQPKKTDPALQPRKIDPEKRITFAFRDAPWIKVMEWLADNSGIPVNTPVLPTGTYNFVPPMDGKGKPMKFTVPEIIDIINNGLEAKKFILLRKESGFTVIDAGTKVNPGDVPLIKADELPEHGKTELVGLLINLQKLVADDF